MSSQAQPSLADLQTEPGAVHVWVTSLDVPPRRAGVLSEEEHARAGRFLHERDRLRWSRAREVLRLLLGEYLKRDPRAIRFTTGANGKPELADERACFNLAHSGGVALYAVAGSQPVGVDVEIQVEGRHIDVLAVAERAFGCATAARLRALDPLARRRQFLEEWVRHEAVLKCLGTGLGGNDAEPFGQRPWVSGLDLPGGWPAAGAIGAVATMEEPSEVSCWEWEG